MATKAQFGDNGVPETMNIQPMQWIRKWVTRWRGNLGRGQRGTAAEPVPGLIPFGSPEGIDANEDDRRMLVEKLKNSEEQIAQLRGTLQTATAWIEAQFGFQLDPPGNDTAIELPSGRQRSLYSNVELGDFRQFRDRRPVFVLGAPRSGTSAMANGLRHGAQFFGWDEGHVFTMLPGLLSALKYAWDRELKIEEGLPIELYALGQMNFFQVADAVIQIYDQIYVQAAQGAGADRWVDKTANIGALVVAPLLHQVYPEARFIFMHRHPIKFALSFHRKFPGQPLESTGMFWPITMRIWEKVKQKLPSHTYREIGQADLTLRPAKVLGELQILLGLNREQVEGVGRYWASSRPESTGSSRDDQEIFLEDMDWDDQLKSWLGEQWEPEARRWGYTLRSPGRTGKELRKAS